MSPAPDRRIRVMLADDFPGIHAALANLLTPSCEIVGSVTQGTRIVSDALRLEPDVIVLDLRMPGSNWLDTCQRLKTALPSLRIVIYSANDDEEVRRRALEAGAVGFVSKNRIVDDLLPAIWLAVQADSL